MALIQVRDLSDATVRALNAQAAERADPRLLALLADEELHAPALLDLRDDFSADDAAYVVLAQALDAPLVTADAKLREAERAGVEVRVVTAG